MYERSHNKAYSPEQRREVIEKLFRAWELQSKQSFAQLLINAVLSGQKNINIIDFAHLEDFDIASRVLAYAQYFQNPLSPAPSLIRPEIAQAKGEEALKYLPKQGKVTEREHSIEEILRDFKL